MFEKVCRDFQAQLVEMNGEAEHVHLLIHLPAKALRVELGQQPQRGFQSPTL
jgi:putative transposase